MVEGPTEVEVEARRAYAELVSTRGRIEAGELPWSALMDHFTDDAVFMDPAWGRTTGREDLVDFFDRSMAGLGDWTFPEVFTMVEGHRVVSMWWNRLPGELPDGRPIQVPGVSILHYAGDGRFSYELDIMNMGELGELFAATGWAPPPDLNLPPRHPDRDPTPPPGRDGP
jgi:ketosteroid isomerase-like protein